MKDLKISKELLSEVLNLNITYIERCNNSIIYKISVYDREEEINIYELAHKCKEWVLKQGYRIIINYSKDIKVGIRILKSGKYVYSNENKSEVEAIVKACEWMLKEQNNDTKWGFESYRNFWEKWL